ncbi:hypothetical protein HWV62_6009 [Athelia sp. TMB]|nr:hypothetical protein HWV62_6009 [Athelia sp. TMB]
MDFTLSQSPITNADLVGSDGRTYYSVETPFKMFSKNTRIVGARDGGSQVIGGIEWHALGGAELTIFQACDDVEYKWKEIGKTNVLVVKGQSQTAVATFQRARLQLFSPNKPACLSITPQAIHIKEEIVTTAMWFEEKRHQREKAQQRPFVRKVDKPTSSNASQIFQERLSDHDYVWFDTKSGGEQFYSSTERIGWRLKNDDASAVIHMYNSSENVVTYDGALRSINYSDHLDINNGVCLRAGDMLIELNTNIYTAFPNTTSAPAASPESSTSTWNSSAPFVPHDMSQKLTVGGVCYGANVSFSLELTHSNGSTATVRGGTPDKLGYSTFDLDVAPGVTIINVTAYNATFKAPAAAVLYYDETVKPWKVKSGAGPNCTLLGFFVMTVAEYI